MAVEKNPIRETDDSGKLQASSECEPEKPVRRSLMSSSTATMTAASLLIVLIDQLTKAIARGHLIPGQPIHVIPGVLDLSLSFNGGAAFGIMQKATPLLVLIGLGLIFAIVRLRGIGRERIWLQMGLGSLLGGAVGNLIDRIVPPSHTVTDFISVHVNFAGQQHTWPTFNLADVAIVIGVVIVVFGVHGAEKDEFHE